MKTMRACLFLATCGILSAQSPPMALMEISLEQSRTKVRTTLSPIAVFEKEDEGQQVWRLKSDSNAQYVFVGFDHDQRVRYVTLMAKKGASIPCPSLGSGPDISRRGAPGNYEFTRNPTPDQWVIAKGPAPDHLRSCSLKHGTAKTEDMD